MLRKTKLPTISDMQKVGASMRPQRNAAENYYEAQIEVYGSVRFNEAAA